MMELFLAFIILAVGVGVLVAFLKILLALALIPVKLGFWLVKGFVGLIVAIPLAIAAFVVLSTVVPILFAVAVPLLLLLAVPLLLLGLFVGFLKLVFC